mgnify:FL=1
MNDELFKKIAQASQAGGLVLSLVALLLLYSIEGRIVTGDALTAAVVPVVAKVDELQRDVARIDARLDRMGATDARLAVLEAQILELKSHSD